MSPVVGTQRTCRSRRRMSAFEGIADTPPDVPRHPHAGVSVRHAATVGQSSGSTLTMEAPSLLPTQKLTGVVLLSTKTLRMLVERGSR
jgi:hypothetical protein